MPKTRRQKEEVLDKLTEELKTAKSATLTAFTQLPVNLDQKLRAEFYESGVSYGVIKKTLLKRVFEKLGYSGVDIGGLEGNVSLAVSKDDEVATAKIANEFSEKNKNLVIAGGILENKWIDKVQVEALAKLPSKKELIAKTVYTIKAPITSFVNVLAGNTRSLINVLNAIKKQKA